MESDVVLEMDGGDILVKVEINLDDTIASLALGVV